MAEAALAGGRGGSPFTLRRGIEADRNFIFATWLRSYRHSSGFAKRISDRVFFKFHQAAVTRILARGAEVLITSPADSPETILGYAVLEPQTVHFVYVKKPFRRLGIAAGLLAHVDVNQCVFTHWTDDWNLLHRKWPQAQYNPYLI